MPLYPPPAGTSAAQYALQFFTPSGGAGMTTDATPYFIGIPQGNTSTTTNAVRRVIVPQTGTVTKIRGLVTGNAPGTPSNEQSTISFRLNDTTDTTITSTLDLSSLTSNLVAVQFSNTGLSIAVSAGDYFELKWVTPTWATNPTGNIAIVGAVYITT